MKTGSNDCFERKYGPAASILNLAKYISQISRKLCFILRYIDLLRGIGVCGYIVLYGTRFFKNQAINKDAA